jgi:putative Ca2+/H+ antiporter (TMEM165/GDT1 family)
VNANVLTAFLSIFAAVFVAELGDKTQLASALFASEGGRSPWLVFFAASAALVTSTAVAVAAGSFLRARLQSWPLELIAGGLFIALGAWMIVRHLTSA